MARKELIVLERRKKRVMMIHAASGENNANQASCGVTILDPLIRRLG